MSVGEVECLSVSYMTIIPSCHGMLPDSQLVSLQGGIREVPRIVVSSARVYMSDLSYPHILSLGGCHTGI